MAKSQKRSFQKETGAMYRDASKKTKNELGRRPALTKVGDKRVLKLRTRGNNTKTRLLSAETANILDPKTKKYQKVKIKTIAENPANRHFVRRNIMTKGAIIDTEKGKAKITSRPGQDGIVNAVLIS